VADIDRSLVASGRSRWTMLVRDPEGRCVGGTEATFEPDDPSLVHQGNTGIDPGHRHLGLARWAKGAMLQRIRTDVPGTRRVRTDNARSNAAMLGINDALGFRTIRMRREWQLVIRTA
jgi:RimJ/RimL family protein N-acetyltransferase